ncbi:ParA family protein [Phytopseudomonas seleniipraecipitans]|uniref:Chromosome partitioning protein n=1 Tax=Phytopseudomonas seleniipraecipitans TaxID=640205 RepID=A0A1G7J6R1_9GAMM|nr:ParA family protein [Pseudomonas seleniipraecipitans]SDF20484.1 chromosome partitioning protein [Pseudomonas seleniipraecipitans]
MARVVGFVSEKGGVGKTTACYHIAVGLARYHSKRVLVIDADYQRGGISGRLFPELIEGFGVHNPHGMTLFNKFQQLYSAADQTPNVDILNHVEGVDLIQADPRLSTVSTDKLPSTNNIRSNNIALLAHMKTISNVLTPLHDSYDYVLIDSHPEVSDILRSIIYASDYCVSPVKLDRQSSIGVATIIGEVQNVNNDIEMIRDSLKIEDGYTNTIFSGAIGMMAREYAEDLKQSEQLEYNRLQRAGNMFKNYITEGDGLRVAAANRQPVYDVTSNNAVKQADQFRSLTKEFLRVCK